MADSFPAACFRAAVPGSCPCTVTLGPTGLEIIPVDGVAVRWRYDHLRCEPTGDERAWLLVSCTAPDHPDVTAVVIRAPEALATLADRVEEPGRSTIVGLANGRRALARRHWRNLVLFAACAAGAVVLGWWLLTRVAPRVAADAMPVETERQLGAALATAFLADKKAIAGGPAVDAVQAIVDRLAAVADTRGTTFTVHVVDNPQINALALPGGQIVVFTGLLREAGGPEEVAGVLAHEIQHVLHRHALRRLVQQFGSATVIAMATGGGDIGRMAGRAGQLVQLSYGREQEAEADRDGLALLHRARLPPEALVVFFERLERAAPGALPEFLSTHPDTARRIGELRRLAAALPEQDPTPLPVDWPAVQESLEGER
ncbi:MAG: hypothetical protein EBR86_03595 [Planctomycetia bacterium]|nr:hypothetical protein [Planctomycetia bacterium]